MIAVSALSIQLLTIGCSPSGKAGPSPAPETKTSPAAEQTSNWVVTGSTDPMDNTKEVMLASKATVDQGGVLLIRFKGKTLDAYLSTPDIVEDQHAPVRIKFDEGEPAKQVWSRSTDYRALFSPDPVGLIIKLQSSNKFYIEYVPYQKVPKTVIFDVAGVTPLLPAEAMAAHKKAWDDSNAANAALRAKILPYVHPCKEKNFLDTPIPPGKWCWTDPNDRLDRHESAPMDTKEEAIQNALALKRLGINFKDK